MVEEQVKPKGEIFSRNPQMPRIGLYQHHSHIVQCVGFVHIMDKNIPKVSKDFADRYTLVHKELTESENALNHTLRGPTLKNKLLLI